LAKIFIYYSDKKGLGPHLALRIVAKKYDMTLREVNEYITSGKIPRWAIPPENKDLKNNVFSKNTRIFYEEREMEREKDRAKFVELAEKRVTRTIKDIRLAGNLSNKSNYSYTDQDVRKIIRALEAEIKN